MSSHLTYRPAIDGLRAIAILSVFVYHLNEAWLPGGFSGVDVFFVISGFLITSIIYRDCASGAFSFARFYQRRIARIFPAFLFVGCVTLAFSYYLYGALDVAGAGGGFLSAMLSVANLKMLRQGNYFELSNDTQPYLHYWSLSIEEQFYLVFPFVFYFLFRRFRRGVMPTVTLIVVLSYIACVVVTYWNQAWGFYLLPTRGWEMGAGALLAIAANEWPQARGFAFCKRYLSWVGLALLLLSFVILGAGPVFPGYIALLPVLGSVILLANSNSSGGVVERLLSLSLFVWIGRISYSLYLWHWPVFSLVDYHFLFASEPFRIALKCALSFGAAILCYFIIEKPARHYLNLATSVRRTYVIFFSVTAACVAIGGVVWKTSYVRASEDAIHRGGVVHGGGRSSGTVVLLGDSYASMYGTVLRDVAAQMDKKLIVACADGTDMMPFSGGGSNPLWESAMAIVRQEKPESVILAFSWQDKLKDDPYRLRVMLDALKPYTQRIVLTNLQPFLPAQGARGSVRAGARPPFFEKDAVVDTRARVNRQLDEIVGDRALIIDIARHYIGEDGGVLAYTAAGKPVYADTTHFSEFGAAILKPEFEKALKVD